MIMRNHVRSSLLLCLPNCNFTSTGSFLWSQDAYCKLSGLQFFFLLCIIYICVTSYIKPMIIVYYLPKLLWIPEVVLVIGFWLGISPEATVRCELKLQTQRSAYSRRTDFQSGLFIWLIDWCWTVSSSPCGLACRATSIVHDMVASFPLEARCVKESSEGSCNGLAQTHAPFLAWYSIILLFTQFSHDSVWEETM